MTVKYDTIINPDPVKARKLVDKRLKQGWEIIETKQLMQGGLPLYAISIKKGVNMSNKSITGLRDALWKTIEGVQSGSIEPAKADTIVKAADAIMGTVKLEMQYTVLIDKMGAKGRKIDVMEVNPIAIQGRGAESEAEGDK